MNALYAKKQESEEGQSLSEIEKKDLISNLMHPIKDKLTKIFSSPGMFVDMGVRVSLSNHDPSPMLANEIEKIGKELTDIAVPVRYCIRLKLDEEKSKGSGDLVFIMSEESKECVFSTTEFTLAELEQAHSI